LERTGWKRISCSPVSGSPKLASGGTSLELPSISRRHRIFADFGVYDVKITVPQFEVVGATGLEVDNVDNPDGTGASPITRRRA